MLSPGTQLGFTVGTQAVSSIRRSGRMKDYGSGAPLRAYTDAITLLFRSLFSPFHWNERRDSGSSTNSIIGPIIRNHADSSVADV